MASANLLLASFLRKRAEAAVFSKPTSFCACASVGVRMPLLERAGAMLKTETKTC